MAEKLSVVIALEGGKELKQQLAEIGKEGTKAFNDIKKAADKAGGFEKLDPKTVAASFEKAGVAGAAAITKITDAVKSASRMEGIVQGVKQLENSFSVLGKTLGPLDTEFRKIQQAGTALYKVLGPVGVAGGAVFLAIGAAAVVATQATIGFAESVNKVAAEAVKLGVSVTQYDGIRRALGQIGISADAAKEAIASLKGELDALNIKKLIEAQKISGGVAFSGWSIGGVPMAQLEELKVAALGAGKAAELARAELERITKVKFDPAAEALKRLGVEGGSVEKNLIPIIRALERMPAGVERTNIATTIFKDAFGVELVQALNAGGIEWEKFKAKLAQGIDQKAANDANDLVRAITRLKEELINFGSVSFAPQVTTGINLITQALELLQAGLAKINWSGFGLVAGLAFNPAATAGQLLVATVESLTGVLSRLGGFFGSFGGTALAVIQRVLGGFGMMAREIAGLGTMWTDAAAVVVKAWDAVTGAIGRAIDAVLRFIGLKPQAPAADSGGGGLPMAGGGFVGGRGTGTSDSNLAWLSRGEYVTPARAVRQPGVLAFLEALRRSGGSLSRVLDGMGRFALGGMVAPQLASIPAFAKGGLNNGGGSSRVLNLTIGAETFRGLSVPEHTAQALERFAVHSQIASTGRKPSWKR